MVHTYNPSTRDVEAEGSLHVQGCLVNIGFQANFSKFISKSKILRIYMWFFKETLKS